VSRAAPELEGRDAVPVGEDSELDWLRELAFFTLAGAQLYASDTTGLVTSLEAWGKPRRESAWVSIVAGLVGALTLAYLIASG
jgi:zinc transporter ZupT